MALGGIAPVAKALSRCSGLHILEFIIQRWGQDYANINNEGRLTDTDLDALLSLTKLNTLRGPWSVTHTQLQQLTSRLQLQEVGMSGLLDLPAAREPGAFPHIKLLSASCTSDDDAAAWHLPWRHGMGHCVVDAWELELFPDLERLHGCSVNTLLSRDTASGAILRLSATLQRFAACSDAWTWFVEVGNEPALALPEWLPPGSLPCVHNLFLELAECSMLQAVAAILGAAPNVKTMQVVLVSEPLHADLCAVLRALSHAKHVHTIWMRLIEEHCGYDSLKEIVGALMHGPAVSASCDGSRAASGPGCKMLQRVLFEFAVPDDLERLNCDLRVQGAQVEVLAW